MDTCKLVSTLGEEMFVMKHQHHRTFEDANVLYQRLFSILQYQPGAVKMLQRQAMNFHKIMNRSFRDHACESYRSYAYVAVGNFFKVKFTLTASEEEEVPEVTLDSITYVKDDMELVCSFEALRTKLKTSPSTRNHGYYYTRFSFYENFLVIKDAVTFTSEEEVRMEIQDFLFDYTNLQEVFENE